MPLLSERTPGYKSDADDETCNASTGASTSTTTRAMARYLCGKDKDRTRRASIGQLDL